MAAGYWPAREQEHCQECKARTGAQGLSGLMSSLAYRNIMLRDTDWHAQRMQWPQDPPEGTEVTPGLCV